MKYRKKPVVIDAVRFEYTTEGIDRLTAFCGSSIGPITKARHINARAEAPIITLEDGLHGTYTKVMHIATEGDWIIKGVKGEFYACKPDIFELTYEVAP